MSATNGERPRKPFAGWWARDVVESESCTLSPPARAHLLLVADHTNAFYFCDVAVETIARGIGYSIRTTQRARAELVGAGLMRVFEGGQGRKSTNGYWLPVTGHAPSKADTRVTLNGVKGDTRDTLKESTGVTPVTPLTAAEPPEVIPKGDTGRAVRVTPVTPEVDSEVSRKHARVTSPPVENTSADDSESTTLDATAVPRMMWEADWDTAAQ